MERSSRRVRAVFCARGTSFNTAVDVDIVTGPMHFPFQAPQKTNKADLPEIRGKIMHLVKVLTPAPGITIHKLPRGIGHSSMPKLRPLLVPLLVPFLVPLLV